LERKSRENRKAGVRKGGGEELFGGKKPKKLQLGSGQLAVSRQWGCFHVGATDRGQEREKEKYRNSKKLNLGEGKEKQTYAQTNKHTHWKLGSTHREGASRGKEIFEKSAGIVKKNPNPPPHPPPTEWRGLLKKKKKKKGVQNGF